MPRLALSPSCLARTSRLASRPLSTFSPLRAKAPDSTPGWEGRHGEDHAVNRSPHDPQSKNAKVGMKEKDQGESQSQAIDQGDHNNSNKKAKEDHPEAPGPVLGMNDERGGKGNTSEGR
ncbi:hypothetical protein PV11_05984 [Exophiala sideris]|uniref:Uncharacterized protein n=1 Tax=Exophiala sideris TaxID=1016849 RepID=A0A0D1YRK3_9EURO|nr:hypothetical protein PV11_05984 [Exophiala sideris]